ncbi:hypothetical protein P43SY_003195 [Pythium insidiosum]|uniref:Reverse transcriptase domain-containing protein n=1 Tax=Pythium insidiosum TaxID=114742 RepID=A0AAD5Q9G9_PYTIN|nr:hypothetical protein P43SY_003195 [Pythium insidiosum]
MTPAFPASPVTPQSPLQAADLSDLLDRLRYKKPVTERFELPLKKARHANQLAYHAWRGTAGPTLQDATPGLSCAKTPAEAWHALRFAVTAAVDMVRELPFPPVLLAFVDDTQIVRHGKALICEARQQYLQQLGAAPDTADKYRQALGDWATAIGACTSLEASWALAHSERKWTQLLSRPDLKHLRAPARLSPEAFGRLVAYIVMNPRARPIGLACHEHSVDQTVAVISWLADPLRKQAVRRAADALADRNWRALEMMEPSRAVGGDAKAPADLTVLMGGDFNCILDPELDRNLPPRRAVGSSWLQRLLDMWQLVDVVTPEAIAVSSPADVRAFHARHHTFHTTTKRNMVYSSRLDRWYVSTDQLRRVAGPFVEVPSGVTDHDSVLVRLRRPGPLADAPRMRRRPALRFPLPAYAVTQISEYVLKELQQLETALRFGSATVHCVPKSATPRSGLDFRPLSLTNSDYKIFARLVATRVRTRVSTMVCATQFGFVPRRDVHDAVDLFAVVQALVQQGSLPDTAVAVLLDFAKAYDTLSRRFLLRALHRYGFPTDSLAVIQQMHVGMAVRFQWQGRLSQRVGVRTGIRQGCPLAPLLFVLAINTLLEALSSDPRLPGVAVLDEVVTGVGYADDTGVFLTHPSEEAALLEILHEFGKASGLRVNINKSVVVALAAAGPSAVHRDMVIPPTAQ